MPPQRGFVWSFYLKWTVSIMPSLLLLTLFIARSSTVMILLIYSIPFNVHLPLWNISSIRAGVLSVLLMTASLPSCPQ